MCYSVPILELPEAVDKAAGHCPGTARRDLPTAMIMARPTASRAAAMPVSFLGENR